MWITSPWPRARKDGSASFTARLKSASANYSERTRGFGETWNSPAPTSSTKRSSTHSATTKPIWQRQPIPAQCLKHWLIKSNVSLDKLFTCCNMDWSRRYASCELRHHLFRWHKTCLYNCLRKTRKRLVRWSIYRCFKNTKIQDRLAKPFYHIISINLV